jgi:saccharopine dehydrogenase-like NADP-dependent oxidoreductase
LNECGLDPGIDIMGTMKIVHEAEAAGYKVVSYESYCGGIPVAE